MTYLVIEIAKYLMIFLFAFYTFECFAAFRGNKSEKRRNRIFARQTVCIFMIHLTGFLALYASTEEFKVLVFYLIQAVLLMLIQTCYGLFYEKASRLVTNNLCMLLSIGFLMLTRLSFDKSIKQFAIAVVSIIISLIIPIFIRKVGFIRKLYFVFAIGGIGCLAGVAILGKISNGAKLAVTIAGVSFQPSEFVKLSFIFFVAGMLYQTTSFKQVCITTALAAAHVLVLVFSTDLGGALIFFVTYLVMLYVATKKLFYFASGLLCGAIASVVAYEIFSHVRVRVLAWNAPLSVIDKEGYQICQSLFAIGTGGWFGMGLNQGLPNKIPVVEQDFIFSAIAEELGGIFALCLIMVCVSCFFMFLNIAMQMKDQFYKLVALGLGTLYGFQVILTIGGATKFIPSTGVTLPLVSYGGSSLLSSVILFAIIQGLYIMRQDESVEEKENTYVTGESKKNGKDRRKKTAFDEAEVEDFTE